MLAVSSSIVGTIFSENSMTVTFEPNLFQTEPNSSPIYPPPITAKFFGTLENSNAPVEETISFSSISTLLISEGQTLLLSKYF